MSIVEEDFDIVIVEIVNFVILIQDIEGNFIFYCFQNEVDEIDLEDSIEFLYKRFCLFFEDDQSIDDFIFCILVVVFLFLENDQSFEVIMIVIIEVVDDEVIEGIVIQIQILQNE